MDSNHLKPQSEINSSICCVGYGAYHINRKITNTEIGSREWAITVKNLTIVFWRNVEGFGTLH